MLATEAEAWVDFYLVAGPSAAVLIGLLFVALSINREAIAAHAHFRGQARQTIYALVYVFVISLVVLVPDQADWALGAELLCAALLNLVVAIPR
jgi:cell division protein FtsW (lipid II flippase)